MKSSITLEELKRIYAAHGVKSSEEDFNETLHQCNEQADEEYFDVWGQKVKPRSATEWANHFAAQDAHETRADAFSSDKFYKDAYGE